MCLFPNYFMVSLTLMGNTYLNTHNTQTTNKLLCDHETQKQIGDFYLTLCYSIFD